MANTPSVRSTKKNARSRGSVLGRQANDSANGAQGLFASKHKGNSAASSSTKSVSAKFAWALGVILLCVCVMLQMPAAWVVQKLAPNNPMIQHVSGQVWRGAAVIQLPTAAVSPSATSTAAMPLSASVQWHWQPLKLFVGQLGALLTIQSGDTKLQGELGKGFGGTVLSDWQGKIAPETLAALLPWRLPQTPLVVDKLDATLSQHDGKAEVTQADGLITWAGGELGYPSGGREFVIALPPMRADITTEEKTDSNRLHIQLKDEKSMRLGDIYIDKNAMMDVSLTQRLLTFMPEYQGSAPPDSVVVTVRQPLLGSITGAQ